MADIYLGPMIIVIAVLIVFAIIAIFDFLPNKGEMIKKASKEKKK